MHTIANDSQYLNPVKIREPQRNLFLISESSAHNATSAARAFVTARVFASRLGEALDQEIQNNFIHADAMCVQRTQAHVIAVFKETCARLSHLLRLHRLFAKDSYPLENCFGIVKLVAFPDGIQKVFLAHLGTVRAYILRDRVLHRLTRDHTHLEAQREQELITQEEWQTIDQARDPSSLPSNLAQQFFLRSEFSKNVHDFEPSIQSFLLKKGDRILLSNSGLHFNLPTSEIAEILLRVSDDLQAQEELQSVAERAAVVYSI